MARHRTWRSVVASHTCLTWTRRGPVGPRLASPRRRRTQQAPVHRRTGRVRGVGGGKVEVHLRWNEGTTPKTAMGGTRSAPSTTASSLRCRTTADAGRVVSDVRPDEVVAVWRGTTILRVIPVTRGVAEALLGDGRVSRSRRRVSHPDGGCSDNCGRNTRADRRFFTAGRAVLCALLCRAIGRVR